MLATPLGQLAPIGCQKSPGREPVTRHPAAARSGSVREAGDSRAGARERWLGRTLGETRCDSQSDNHALHHSWILMCDNSLDSIIQQKIQVVYMASPFGQPSHPRWRSPCLELDTATPPHRRCLELAILPGQLGPRLPCSDALSELLCNYISLSGPLNRRCELDSSGLATRAVSAYRRRWSRLPGSTFRYVCGSWMRVFCWNALRIPGPDGQRRPGSWRIGVRAACWTIPARPSLTSRNGNGSRPTPAGGCLSDLTGPHSRLRDQEDAAMCRRVA